MSHVLQMGLLWKQGERGKDDLDKEIFREMMTKHCIHYYTIMYTGLLFFLFISMEGADKKVMCSEVVDVCIKLE